MTNLQWVKIKAIVQKAVPYIGARKFFIKEPLTERPFCKRKKNGC